jgi:hypothetical protein
VWGGRRSLAEIATRVGVATFLFALVALLLMPDRWLGAGLFWQASPLVSLIAVPLAVIFHRALREMDENGLLRDLAMTSVDRAAFARAVLRRLLMPGYIVMIAIFLATVALAVVGGVLLRDAVAPRSLERVVTMLSAANGSLLLAWHFAIVLLRLWDFLGETVANTRIYMARIHRFVTLPVALVVVPLLALLMIATIFSLGLITALAVALAAWTGDGAWGWLPAIREHVLFAPLREDEF